MYSPKIDEALIPILYHTARGRGLPMTRLVDRLLIDGLMREQLPQTAQEAFSEYLSVRAQEQDLTPYQSQ